MSTFKSEFLHTLSERGFIHQISDETGLDDLLSKERVTAYIGFDPTAPSLHAGSLIQIMMLRWLQKTGGKPITLMNVREPYDSRIGSDVTLEVIRGPITLTATGRIMANARIGDEVRVVNHHTKSVVKGTLVAPDKVRIR